MIQSLFIWVLTLIASIGLINFLSRTFPVINARFLILLFFYHSALAMTYFLYAMFNPSDSANYYHTVLKEGGEKVWSEYFKPGTDFVEFLTYPLVNYFSLSYESCMAIFAFIGFLGFVFFYIFFKERILYRPKIFGFDGISVIFFLPNLHFWSSSIGKGSVIFFAFGIFFFSLKSPISRIIAMAIGGYVIYMVRAHIFFVVLIAIAVGYTFSTKGVSIVLRIVILALAAGLMVYIYDDILTITGLTDESILDPFISHRASELAKATSGIDISNYSLPEKLFAFCFRPLFVDAPGILGFIVSFENLLYLLLFIRILYPAHLKTLLTGDAIVKTCFLTFAGVSLALSQITGNLGLAMRQKSQVMILMMFVILKLLDNEAMVLQKNQLKRKARQALRMKQQETQAVA